MSEAENPFRDEEDEESRNGLAGQLRASFSVIALIVLFVAASGAGTLGGLVATGVGGEPLERPAGFTFDTVQNDSVTELVIRHAGAAVPHPERVYVVDEAGNRVPWTAIKTGEGIARVSGTNSPVQCLRQGSTYRIVFEGRTITGTIAAHEIAVPITADSVNTCQKRSKRNEDDGNDDGGF
ncbi:MAG: hypothetical protein ABEI75_03240 [Halobaculum sp.]